MLIRDHQNMHLKARLNLDHFSTFFIEQECNYLYWHLAVDRGGIFLHGFFLNNSQDL